MGHGFSLRGGQFELGMDVHAGGGIGADGDDRHFPQRGLGNKIERGANHLAIDLAVGLDEHAFPDIGANRELPVGARLALGDDVGRAGRIGDDFALNLQGVALDGRLHHAHAGVGPVLMVGQEGHACRDVHAGEGHDHRIAPAGKVHLAARIGQAGNPGPAAGCRFNQREFSLHHPPCPPACRKVVLSRRAIRPPPVCQARASAGLPWPAGAGPTCSRGHPWRIRPQAWWSH